MSFSSFFYLWNVNGQQIIEVPQQSVFGRSEDSYYVIDSSVASRFHFKLYLKDSNPVIEDLKSSNGTFVNGLGLDPGEIFELNNYDIITVGTSHYVFFFAHVLKDFDKEKLKAKFGEDFPKDFQEEILKKLIAFERYALPRFHRILVARKFQFAIADVESSRNEELGVLEEKKRQVDEQKENLEKLYREKMEIINSNYKKIEVQQNNINEKHDQEIEIIKSTDTQTIDLSDKDLFSKYFHSSYDEENSYLDIQEEATVVRPINDKEKVVKGLSFSSSNKSQDNQEESD